MWLLAARFQHEWHGQTTLNPVAIALLLAMAVCLMSARRTYAVWPIIAIACFVSPAQRVVIGGMDFTFLRLMIVVGWLRLLVRNEWRGLHWHGLDTLMMLFFLLRTLAVLFTAGTGAAFVSKLGAGMDSVAAFFLFRCLIRSLTDLRAMVSAIIWLSIPIALAFAIEWMTRRNCFAAFGGVPEVTAVRQGRLRCQGAFAHPILAGCFWATMMPLIATNWCRGGLAKLASLIGIMTSCVIVVACSSSTPVAGVLAATVGALLFPLRYQMRWVRWAVLLALVSLHVVMNAPVWHLIGRISFAGGSGGAHRYRVIDAAIRHIHEWYLIGSSQGTEDWGAGLYDITNQFVLHGLEGGLPLLGVFIALIAVAFRNVGRMWRSAAAKGDRAAVIAYWGLGVALFVHCINFLGVTYFGQITITWYLLLAVIGSLTPAALPRVQVQPHRKVAWRNTRRRRAPLGTLGGPIPG